MKDSGLGRRHGADGIRKYTESQTVSVQRGMPIAPPPLVSAARLRRDHDRRAAHPAPHARDPLISASRASRPRRGRAR